MAWSKQQGLAVSHRGPRGIRKTVASQFSKKHRARARKDAKVCEPLRDLVEHPRDLPASQPRFGSRGTLGLLWLLMSA